MKNTSSSLENADCLARVRSCHGHGVAGRITGVLAFWQGSTMR